MQPLPQAFTNRIKATFGEEGERWIRDFPSTLERISRQWSLTSLTPHNHLSYNYVLQVRRSDGFEAILKLGVPNKELFTEIEALRLMDGRGAVRLFESDSENGAMLLERLKPGRPVLDLDDDGAATSIAARVMQRLWRPIPEDHSFPTIPDWGKGFKRLRVQFDGGTGPFPEDLVEKAESIYNELSQSSVDSVLLHGDLHHWNILSAEREPWLAIDPKGVIGEPAYEVGAWLRNPYPEILKLENIKQITMRRLSQFSEMLGMDKSRLLRWGFAQVVLSAWWSYEDNVEEWEVWIGFARIMAEML